jgi:chromate transporter
VVLKASLLSSGGFGNLPSLHEDLVSRGWANERQFAGALVLGQLAPGPSGLWPVALGYFVGGVAGALLATAAITLPPLLVIPADRLHRRYSQEPAVRGFVRGLTLVVASAVPLIYLRIAISVGLDLFAVLIFASAFSLFMLRRVPPIVVLALGALAGAVVYR